MQPMSPTERPVIQRRDVYCVLSAKALPYAYLALKSLTEHCDDNMRLRLITDGADDKTELLAALATMDVPVRHLVSVHAQQELDGLAEVRFEGLPALRQFRFGHPCWRKITDPLLFAQPGDEIIILDPDLYFPNHFRFEATPSHGILLMWQPPSCLLPHETVMRAYEADIALAHHVDIGVAHVRNTFDLAWLDWLVATLGGQQLPRAMHVEAIVWAAMAMKEGGGYLDPAFWHCWRNAHWKRLSVKLGVAGERLLNVEPFGQIKCFHGGGAAKWWIPGYERQGRMPTPRVLDAAGTVRPFEPLTRDEYLASQRLRRVARAMGYYKLVGG